MKIDECIFFQLAKASQKGIQFWNQKVAHLNLTGVQAMIVNFLADEDGVTAGYLSERVLLTGATLTGIIDRIAKLGFIERKPKPGDRRAILICLTPKGKKIAKKVQAAVASANQEFLADLTRKEEASFRGTLTRLRG